MGPASFPCWSSRGAFTLTPPSGSDQPRGPLFPQRQWQGGDLVSPPSPPRSGPLSVLPRLLLDCPWLLTARGDGVSELSRSPLLDPGLGAASAHGGRRRDMHPAGSVCRRGGAASSLGLVVCVTSRQGPGGREGQRCPRGGHASRPAAAGLVWGGRVAGMPTAGSLPSRTLPRSRL